MYKKLLLELEEKIGITKESREKAKKVKKYYNDGVPIKQIKEMTNLKSDNSIYQYVEANRKGKTNG